MKLSERLTIHAQDCALASRDSNDMVIGFHQMNDLAEALAEAAQLARRVEEAPVGEITAGYNGPCAAYGCTEADDATMSGLVSQRVRLVRDE